MIRLFTGYDAREAVGFHAFAQSVLSRATQPVSIIPLSGRQVNGSTAFTYARYLIPKLCDYQGWAIFADGCDMACRTDISALWDLRDPYYAVQVVKHDYRTNAPRKFLGTPMECANIDYRCKNWSSLMLINCAHPGMLDFTIVPSVEMHQFYWLKEQDIGALPVEWNWLCDEYGVNEEANMLHWTQGIPAFTEYAHAPMAEVWEHEYRASQQGHQLRGATV